MTFEEAYDRLRVVAGPEQWVDLYCSIHGYAKGEINFWGYIGDKRTGNHDTLEALVQVAEEGRMEHEPRLNKPAEADEFGAALDEAGDRLATETRPAEYEQE